LENYSRLGLNSFEISQSRSISEEVEKIENLIKSLKEKKEIPSTEKYNSSQGKSFNVCVLNI